MKDNERTIEIPITLDFGYKGSLRTKFVISDNIKVLLKTKDNNESGINVYDEKFNVMLKNEIAGFLSEILSINEGNFIVLKTKYNETT